MEAPVKRKIVAKLDATSASWGRSSPNPISPKSNIDHLVVSKPRILADRTLSRPRSVVGIGRPSSPASVIGVSERTGPNQVLSGTAGAKGVVAAKAKTSSIALTRRQSSVHEPKPSTNKPNQTLRTVNSFYSLPVTPIEPTSDKVTHVPVTKPFPPSLQPTQRNHGRQGSISESSSVSATSPSSTSHSTSTVDPSEAGRTSQSIGGSSVGSSIHEPIRVKSKVSNLSVLNNPRKSAVSYGSPPLSPKSTSILRKVSSASPKSATPTPSGSSSSSSRALSPIQPSNQQPHPRSVRSGSIRSTTDTRHFQPFLPPPSSNGHSLKTNLSRSSSLSGLSSPPQSLDGAQSTPSPLKPPLELDSKPQSGELSPTEDTPFAMHNEAKSNRKIADLEITNKSLMAINANLEGTKTKQAKEIRELRKRLRETRLTLPPKTFAQLKDTSDEPTTPPGEDEEEEEEEPDPVFDRIRTMLEGMINHATDALKRSIDHPELNKNDAPAMKVLSADEVRMYETGEVSREADLSLSYGDGWDDSAAPSEADTEELSQLTGDTDEDMYRSIPDRRNAATPVLLVTRDSPRLSGRFSPQIKIG